MQCVHFLLAIYVTWTHFWMYVSYLELKPFTKGSMSFSVCTMNVCPSAVGLQLPCNRHEFLNVHCSQLIEVVSAFKTRWGKEVQITDLAMCSQKKKNLLPLPPVTGQRSCCVCTSRSQYFKKPRKGEQHLHIKVQHLTRSCRPAWTHHTVSGVHGEKEVWLYMRKGGKSKSPAVEAYGAFTRGGLRRILGGRCWRWAARSLPQALINVSLQHMIFQCERSEVKRIRERWIGSRNRVRRIKGRYITRVALKGRTNK